MNIKELLARNRRDIWRLSEWDWNWTHNNLVGKRTLDHLGKLTKWLSWVVRIYLCGACYYILLSCHWLISEWTYIHMNIKELFALKRRGSWKLSDRNWNWNYNHLVRKGTPNHLVKLTKWLRWVVRTYLYRAFECMLLSCHVRIWERICTLYLPECQETLCSKQARYLKIKWLQLD